MPPAALQSTERDPSLIHAMHFIGAHVGPKMVPLSSAWAKAG
jgi:hypothetical protein